MTDKYRKKTIWRRSISKLVHFKQEISGAIAIEFAFAVPLLITLYLGMVEMGNAIAADRKVTLLSSTVGDIVAQHDQISKAELDNIFLATKEIMRPFQADNSNLRIEVFSITVDSDDAQISSWPGKVTNGGTCGNANAAAPAVPSEMLAVSPSVIVAKVCYKYSSLLNYFFKTDPSFNEVFFIRPRHVDAIEWNKT
ncbi:MAG: TadE/TadG family type IV pilus assembly protein [Hyphomicrobiales bacterium]